MRRSGFLRAIVMLAAGLGTLSPSPASAQSFFQSLFGFGNSAHMLAFSTAGDVVDQNHIGTSAAIVNGFMFILGGIMISRPGARIGLGLHEGVPPGSLEMAQFAGRPLLVAICTAFVIALVMQETHPKRKG